MNSYYGNYRTRTFADIFYDAEEKLTSDAVFLAEMKKLGLPLKISEEKTKELFFLLYARYGNSSIASSDEEQFKYKIGSIIYMYGPAWEKRLETLDKLYNLTEEEILRSEQNISNLALNPDTVPAADTYSVIDMVSQQNVNNRVKGKMEGYATYFNQIVTDVTDTFLDKFKKCFITVVSPDYPLWYTTEEE